MTKTFIIAAALVGLAVPAVAQNFTVPAGDSNFTRANAVQAYQPESGFVALAPESAQTQPAGVVHRTARHTKRVAR